MTIFAVILLILCALGSFIQIARGEVPLGGLALSVFFTLYLLGIGS